MARSNDNDATLGLSGRFGRMFSFRQRFGQTLATRRRTKKGLTTANQQIIKDRFKDAVIYGKGVHNDDTLKALYSDRTKIGVSAYNRAVSDFMKAPEIKSIDTTNYHGQINDTVVVRATDDFEVIRVAVTIHSALGGLIEEGDALIHLNEADWTYTITQENAVVPGSTIKATAFDRAGNITEFEITV